MSEQRASLEKSFSKLDVFSLAFGAMIGWGWVMLAGNWVQNGGWLGSIVAFAIGAVMCIFVGLCYAELTPMLPVTGGGLVYSYRAMGYGWSWVAAWSTAFAYLGVAAWEGIAISTAIDYLINIPKIGYLWTLAGYDVYASWALVGVICGALIMWMNFKGASASAGFQNAATIVLAIIGVVLVFGGAVKGNPEWMGPAFTNAKGLIAVMIMAPAMYVGFDVIPQAAEEMNVPLKQIPKVLFLAIAMASLWYIGMCFATAISAPHNITMNGKVPVADAFAYLFNASMWGKVVIVGGLAGIVTSWNGFIVGGARVMFAMGRAKMLPPIFGTVNEKSGQPTAALLLIGFFVLISPFLGKNALVWFVDASSFGTVLIYLMVSISFLMLRKQEPNLSRPFKVSSGNLIGWLAVIMSVIFGVLYLPWSPGALVWPYEWVMLIIWGAIGVILAIWNKSAYSNVTSQERELLIFGKELARTDRL
ncbi:MAG: APC family permease [Methylocystaceae bacterium]